MVLPSNNPYTEAKKYILIADLAIFVPLAFIEIVIIQRFKVDRLFLVTAAFYSICFALRLLYSLSLSTIDLRETSDGTKAMIMAAQTI